MYNKDRILERCRSLLPAVRKLLADEHFLLRRYSIEQSASASAYLNDQFKKNPNYQPKGKELEFILNERAVCRADFRYWANRYGFIKDLEGKVRRITFNIAQRIILDVLAEMEEGYVALLLQLLKARQLGVSTLWQLLLQHRVQFHKNITAIMGSSDPDRTDDLSKMLMLSFDMQPSWLVPKRERYKTGLKFEYANGSLLNLEHGTQFKDIGRGKTPTCFHLTEVCDYEEPESLIDAGLMRAIHDHPMILGGLESTANGNTGWWYDKYWYNRKHYPKSARFKAIFLPWFVGSDIYPTEAWLRKHQWEAEKGAWKPDEKTVSHAKAAAQYAQDDPLIRKYLGEGWEMPPEQMYFYENSIEEYRENKTLHTWYQEMAASPLEAFQSRELSIFDPELLARFRDAAKRPLAVFGIRGASIPLKYHPKNYEINTKLPIVPVKAKWHPSLPPFEFELVPLKYYSDIEPTGKLFVWEWPTKGRIYGLGGDTGDGLGEKRSDDSVIEVMRKGDRNTNDAQAAEFASPDISGTDLWPWALAIGTFFSVPINNKLMQPFTVIETNREGGKNLVKELSKRGFDQNVYRALRRSATRRAAQAIATPGLNIDPINRENILQWAYRALTNDYLEINSQWFVDQMSTFVKRDDGKWGAAKGKHDDRIFALASVYYCLYEPEARNTTPEPFIDRSRVIPAEEKYPVYTDEQAMALVPQQNLQRLNQKRPVRSY